MHQADWFTQNAPSAPPPQGDWFSANAPKPEGAISRFLTRATGLPVSDIAAHPGKYLNPLSDEYQQAAKDNANQPVTAPSLREMIPFGQTAKDISDRNYAGAAGDLAPGALAALQFAGPKVAELAPQIGRTAGAIAKPVGRMAVDAATDIPVVRGVLKGAQTFKDVPGQVRDIWQPKATPTLPEPAESVYPEAQQNEPENVEPTALEQAKARFQAAQQQQPSTQTPESYPNGIQKRPTDRAEIVSDKAVEDAMRNDLEKQGWRALSQERKEFYANNQPGMSKGDLVANARVEAVRTAAEQQVQKILAESNPPVKYSKTVIPKAKIAAPAQPVAEDLNSPNRLIDLMQQSIDALNARKGNR